MLDILDFKRLLTNICDRPGMYVGRPSLADVSLYLAGICHGLRLADVKFRPFDGFMQWIEMRFCISHPAWHWTRILEHVYGSDLACLQALPSLYDEFVTDREHVGIEGIKAETERRLWEKYGQNYGEPAETKTKPRSEESQ
jgi:hypothetical protein